MGTRVLAGDKGFGRNKRLNTFGNVLKNSFTIDLENVVIFWKSAWGVLKGFMSSFFWAGYLYIIFIFKTIFFKVLTVFCQFFVSAIT